jgi:secreted trypsin-like serine protease
MATERGLRIVGGQEAPEDAFPDCCAVGNESGWYCSGTLIAPTVVVTAAHCRSATLVFLRGNDVRRPEEGDTLRVAAQVYHPTEDLSVLVLERPSSVPPRRVAQGAEVRGDEGLLVGFGCVDRDGKMGYGVKRMVTVPIRSICCRGLEPGLYGCRRGTEMVAGHPGLDRDSCHGDSGGPLYVRAGDAGGWLLLGATSRGVRNARHECGDGGIYVRVDLCLPWIEDVTGQLIGQRMSWGTNERSLPGAAGWGAEGDEEQENAGEQQGHQ